jgi:excisionase family DNA binding protein
MRPEAPYGQGRRMLALWELCEWLNITECHARKLVARNAIPYRKVGHLLRFPESEVEQWISRSVGAGVPLWREPLFRCPVSQRAGAG